MPYKFTTSAELRLIEHQIHRHKHSLLNNGISEPSDYNVLLFQDQSRHNELKNTCKLTTAHMQYSLRHNNRTPYLKTTAFPGTSELYNIMQIIRINILFQMPDINIPQLLIEQDYIQHYSGPSTSKLIMPDSIWYKQSGISVLSELKD